MDAASALPPTPPVEPELDLPTPPATPSGVPPTPPSESPRALYEASLAAATPLEPPLVPSLSEPLIPHLKVDVPEVKDGNGWEAFHKFLEMFVGHMETHVWPIDPEADIHPTMLPFVYAPPDHVQDERFLKELLYLLTIGLQGQGFGWKYKMLFDLHWNATRGGYMAELTSIRRVSPREIPKPVSEVTVHDS